MQENPLQKLYSQGQSVWLDYISRQLIASGKLRSILSQDSVVGMTSNPTIFEKAIAESHDYDGEIRTMAQQGMDALAIYEKISQQDVRSAADEFLSVYQKTNRKDGYVSLEVNPHLAYDTQGTVLEAQRFYKELDRPNVMIKVPATKQGLPAIEQLTSEGINVNVTLIFSVVRYKEVVDAYVRGLAKRVHNGHPIDGIHSVASFFISRIDTSVDSALEKMAKNGNASADSLMGQIAVSSAKAAYRMQKEIYSGEDFRQMLIKGANVQRLLWASTSTKNPKYSDVKYVEELIGADTVNTIPNETLDLYRDHGRPELRLDQGMDEALRKLEQLKQAGVDLEEISELLEKDGVDKFNKSFDDLLSAIQKKMAQ